MPPRTPMSSLKAIEIDGAQVGILTRDHSDCSFRFHSGVAPYDLLDGSRFVRVGDACDALHRMSRAARKVPSIPTIREGNAA